MDTATAKKLHIMFRIYAGWQFKASTGDEVLFEEALQGYEQTLISITMI